MRMRGANADRGRAADARGRISRAVGAGRVMRALLVVLALALGACASSSGTARTCHVLRGVRAACATADAMLSARCEGEENER